MSLEQKKITGRFQAFIKGSLNDSNGERSIYNITWIDCNLNVDESRPIKLSEDREYETLADEYGDKEEPTPAHTEGQHKVINIPSLPLVKVSYKGKTAELSIYAATLKVDKITPVRREEAFRLQHVTGYLEGFTEIGSSVNEEPNYCAWFMLLIFCLPLLLLFYLPCGWTSFLIPVLIAWIYGWLYPWICEHDRSAKFVIPLAAGIIKFKWTLVLVQVCVLTFVLYTRSHDYGECLDYPWPLWFLGALALCFWSLEEVRPSVVIPSGLWCLICLLMIPRYCDFAEDIGVSTLPELVEKVIGDLKTSGDEGESHGDHSGDAGHESDEGESNGSTDADQTQSPKNSQLPKIDPAELPIEVPKDKNGQPMCSFSQELSNDFLFDTGKSIIKTNAQTHLKTLAHYIRHIFKSNPGLKVVILGYADHRGSDEYNKNLSQQRALSVRKYLNLMKVNRFIVSSFGEGEIKEDEDVRDDQALSKYRKVILNVICEEDQ